MKSREDSGGYSAIQELLALALFPFPKRKEKKKLSLLEPHYWNIV
jgi:hypothetical protein